MTTLNIFFASAALLLSSSLLYILMKNPDFAELKLKVSLAKIVILDLLIRK